MAPPFDVDTPVEAIARASPEARRHLDRLGVSSSQQHLTLREIAEAWGRPLDELVAGLNRVLGEGQVIAASAAPGTVVLDVREALRQRREPFGAIMAAAGRVPPGGRLILYATFKPTPLFWVLKARGFEPEATRLPGGDWRVVFARRAGGAGAVPQAPAPEAEGGQAAARPAAGTAPGLGAGTDPGTDRGGLLTEIHLDNRGLEPPEPLARTLDALLRLAPGGRLVGLYERRPVFLLPKLTEMGYTYQVEEEADGTVRVTIEGGPEKGPKDGGSGTAAGGSR